MPSFRGLPDDLQAMLWERVTRRLHPAGGLREQWLRGYARNKLRMDGLYQTVLQAIPAASSVLDLGCGVGLLGLLLAERRAGDEVCGIEWDASKARLAEQLVRDLPRVQVIHGDLTALPWPACTVIALLDVIHYFPPDLQRGLLARAAHHLPPGGRLVLRVMDPGAGGLSPLVRGIERLAVLLGWNRAQRVHWRSRQAILQDLNEAGLSSIDSPGDGGRLHGNRIMVFEKGTRAHG